ncbi:TPA: thymidine kinase [Clostridium botulinum]|uniref:thymidine kinase n=1 Tax=Clostridium botulinum TaxID=1491 RepID=UPI001C9B1796|nr:hypothetical protein [Clostridium botulinum]MBY6909559.1 thymidine kinase [Clostridium botulinum]
MAGKLVVNTGSMFSGKSTELLRQGERHILAGKRVIYLKSATDFRYKAGQVNTHSGRSYVALKMDINKSILTTDVLGADVVLIDEVQFFNGQIIKDIQALIRMNKIVYVSGLDLDSNGNPWETTMYLMSIADEVQKFKAVCCNCGADSYISAKKIDTDSETIIDIGGYDKYMPLCRDCYSAWERFYT